jgi:hypothetical protein
MMMMTMKNLPTNVLDFFELFHSERFFRALIMSQWTKNAAKNSLNDSKQREKKTNQIAGIHVDGCKKIQLVFIIPPRLFSFQHKVPTFLLIP